MCPDRGQQRMQKSRGKEALYSTCIHVYRLMVIHVFMYVLLAFYTFKLRSEFLLRECIWSMQGSYGKTMTRVSEVIREGIITDTRTKIIYKLK